jgi:hypothetical protein
MGMNLQQRRRDLENLPNVNHAIACMGSATVERPFSLGSRTVRRGEVLSRDELLKIPPANLRALAANHFLNLKLDPGAYRRAHNERSDNAKRQRKS